MNSNPTGNFREIGPEMCEILKDITKHGNDAKVRKWNDGTYDVYEVKGKKRKPAQNDMKTE